MMRHFDTHRVSVNQKRVNVCEHTVCVIHTSVLSFCTWSYDLFKHFKDSRRLINDDPHSGELSISIMPENIPALRNMVLEDHM